jgi:hypothetical protein
MSRICEICGTVDDAHHSAACVRTHELGASVTTGRKNERANVNALVKAIQKNSPGVYVYIDRDAGNVRHTSSGYDFLLAFNNHVVFAEAKEAKGKLSDWQEFTRLLIQAAACKYCVVRFLESGEFFSVDNGKMVAIKDASFQDFL